MMESKEGGGLRLNSLKYGIVAQDDRVEDMCPHTCIADHKLTKLRYFNQDRSLYERRCRNNGPHRVCSDSADSRQWD